MTCAACQQNRMPCGTPWTCQDHESQANYERVMSLPITLLGEEPPEPPAPKPRSIGWRDLAKPFGLIAAVAVLVIWLCHL